MTRMSAFPWYAGKFKRLGAILPHLPKTEAFCEPFCGSAAVTLNRPPSPIETINDLDGEVMNYFEQVRNDKDELVRLLSETPYSRAEFERAVERTGPESTEEISGPERARMFAVKTRQGFGGQYQVAGDWGYRVGGADAGMKARWVDVPARLTVLSQRLRNIQLEARPALDILKRFDTPNTLFYVDPPYHLDGSTGHAAAREGRNMRRERETQFGMTEQDHIDLLEALNNVDGRVALSGYASGLYMEHLGSWNRIDFEIASGFRSGSARGGTMKRTECLWLNYD